MNIQDDDDVLRSFIFDLPDAKKEFYNKITVCVLLIYNDIEAKVQL